MTFFGKHKRKKAASNKLVKGTASTPSLPLQASPVPAVPRITSQSSYNLAPPPPWSPPFPPRPQTSSAPGRWQATNLPYRYPPAVNPASSAYLPLPPQSPPIQSNPWPQRPSKWKSSTNLPQAITNPVQTVNDGIGEWQQMTTGYLNRGAALCDLIGNKFDAVITLIDEERFSGDERELVIYQPPHPVIRGGGGLVQREVSRSANNAITSAITSTNYFSKANLYANARLPPNLPPLKLYMPTYPLLCLAAQYSQRVYTRPSGAERDTHVDADWRMGTKAMVIKSVPIDDMNTVVFAIRGSQTFMDWAVNLNSAPTAPTGFLDDQGNLCHSGFLAVAKKMIKPVGARLRFMLEENPSRAAFSLLITGHSAGGAVASLLYSHMLATSVKSELNILTGCFKRVHCVTFGAPPVSLLPLTKHSTRALRKSLFLSFVNEGDPVPRADKAYVRSLLDLYASPAPGSSLACLNAIIPTANAATKMNILKRPNPKKSATAPKVANVVWKVPPSTLSNAGRLVLLRVPFNATSQEDVRACVTTDEQLRGVMFGDPLMHMMKVYARRIEILATRAVTARVVG